MKCFLSFLAFLIVYFSAIAETLEYGFVKEYRGKEAKTPLAGVELMIKGAPSTISDTKGSFILKFATLAAGEKVNYTEIYKEGFVIFNKEALEAWRISNNGRPFTIVMCKENEFRALKKKFYGIIEESYKAEFIRQKELAEKVEENAERLKTKLKLLEDEYNEKMSNINTYVELFSRIDRCEMDEVEAKALEFMESGKIDEAIRMYEELQLERQVESQLSKWNAAEEMRRAADGMESQAQADLVILASKMKKQISLYAMGGRDYDSKRLQLINQLIPILYKLNGIVNESYNEDLGMLIIQRSSFKNNKERLADYIEAANLPSAVGLECLAHYHELRSPSVSKTDSIRGLYIKALKLCSEEDSIFKRVKTKLEMTPDAFYKDVNGNIFPFKRLDNNEAVLMPYGPYYSTHIEGNVILPSLIYDNDTTRIVTVIENFAFGNNRHLKSITFPKCCREVKENAFSRCDSLSTIFVNADLEKISISAGIKRPSSIPINAEIVFSKTPKYYEWILEAISYFYSENISEDFEHNVANDNKFHKKYVNPLLKGMVMYLLNEREKKSDDTTKLLNDSYQLLINNCLEAEDTISALNYAQEAVKNKVQNGNLFLSCVYNVIGEYDLSIDVIKKAKNKTATYYNQLAYAYAYKQDFINAHKSVDKAISIATSHEEKARFIDSKGEIYLMQGLENEAKKALENAISESNDYFNKTHTKLYEYFYSNDNDNDNEEYVIEKQKERNIAITLMALEYLEPRIANIEGYNFELFKQSELHRIYNISPEDKEFVNPSFSNFVSTLWKAGQNLYAFAGNNNISFNSEWIGIIDADKNRGFDDTARINLTTLISINELYKRLPCANLNESDVKSIYIYGKSLSDFIESLSHNEAELMDAMLAGRDVDFLTQTFHISQDSIAMMVEKCINYSRFTTYPDIENKIYNSDSIYAKRYNSAIADVINNSQILRNRLIKYAKLACLAAKWEYQFIDYENFRSPDYEELVAIGIIAVQVMLNNKTEEQLAKFNELYIATAISWAIRNELGFRYEWYYLEHKHRSDFVNLDLTRKCEEAGIDYSKHCVRINVYSTLKNLFYISQTSDVCFIKNNRLFESLNADSNFDDLEIIRMAKSVLSSRDKISPEYQDCYDYFFSKESSEEQIQDMFSLRIIHSMLNEVQEILNELNFHGY